MLLTLYSLAAGKPPEQLTLADVRSPAAVEYVRHFQASIDQYVPDTLILNGKIYHAPRFGQLFFVAEDNLVKLYLGRETAPPDPDGKKPGPMQRTRMVMIYPKEGSIPHTHPAAIVRAPWVSPEETEAAQRWIDYLQQDEQQCAFNRLGFRPATGITCPEDPITSANGVDRAGPRKTLDLRSMDPAAVEAIARSWGDVKKPGVVAFVMDTSGSMAGGKLEEARGGMLRALDGIGRRNLVGLLPFSSQVNERIAVGPVAENGNAITRAVERMRAAGETALYDAILEGIKMVDEAPGDADTIRGVVVLTDGKANRGQTLDRLIRMESGERPATCSGLESEPRCLNERGQSVPKEEVIGTRLAVATRHPEIKIFFVGIGDADLHMGRMLAEAARSAFKGATEKDLARVLEEFGKYF